MPIQVPMCPNCGAPVTAGVRDGSLCLFCKAPLVNVPWMMPPDGPLPPDPVALAWNDECRPRALVAGQKFVLLGRLARGDGSDVFLARRDERLTEMVVLKVLRALSDEDLLTREWKALEQLHRSQAQGQQYFSQLLPQLVVHGKARCDDGSERLASVFRWRSGFQHTLQDVAKEHPQGLDGRAVVWIWKRTLELLGWLHRAGFAHGAVLPQHILVHPRDHGVVLVGWSSCTPLDGQAPPIAVSASNQAYYPPRLWTSRRPDVGTDIVMSARCMVRLLGGDPKEGRLPSSVPAPLASLLEAYSQGGLFRSSDMDAWTLMDRVSQAAHDAFGPPKYHRLSMPGWS